MTKVQGGLALRATLAVATAAVLGGAAARAADPQEVTNRVALADLKGGAAGLTATSGSGDLAPAGANTSESATAISGPAEIAASSSGSFSYWLQVGARTSGLEGSEWRTDLGLLNSGLQQANVTVYLYPPGGGEAKSKSTYVPAGVQSVLTDLVAQLGTSGSGAVEVRSDRPLLVTSRTYNEVSSGATCTPGGTFGQYYPAYTEAEGLVAGESAWLPHLAESEQFRSNLAFTNIGTVAATVRVELFDASGTKLTTFSVSLNPTQYQQELQVFKHRAGLTNVLRGSAKVTVISGVGVIFSASVVDNLTNDPTTIPMIAGDSSVAPLNEITVMLPGGVPLVLVEIPHGTFLMGSPETEPTRVADETQHEVTISEDYYIGKTEVTQRQWLAVMGSNPSHFTSCGLDCPVEQVSWNDICGGTTGSSCAASSFIGKVNELLETTKFRLPTEAEWERAARGGTTGPFAFDTSANPNWNTTCGSFPEALPYMWWCNDSGSTTHPVGTKHGNPYGLYDMHGNVWEWVADWYEIYSSASVTDPQGPSSGSYRVRRGGSWYNNAQHCRSAFRNGHTGPNTVYLDIGFRLARSR